MTTPPPVLDIKQLSLRARGQLVLDHIDLRIDPHDFVGIIGPNGAGKTVLLKVILGLIAPSEGQIHVFGVAPQQARGKIGYVPQYAKFDANFPIRVLDVVLMGRLKQQKTFGRNVEDEEKALKALEQMDMRDLAGRQIGQLSGGQVQRVLIARALASEPKLLLLDEPTASLDTRIGRDVYEVLAELSKQMTILLVSHDIGVISKYVKTIACLNRKLHYHQSKEISGEVLAEVYGCPVELIAHGHAHRVLSEHEN